MSTTSPILPIEIFEEILDHVAHNSSHTLKACAQANSVLRDLCQKRLFRDITISYKYEAACHPGLQFVTPTTISIFDRSGAPEFNYKDTGTGNGFLCFLQRSPHFGDYIRTLRLEFLEDGLKISPNRHHFSLVSILPKLRNVKTLVFSRLCGIGSDHYKDVEFNPLTTRLLLKSIMSLPNSLSHIDTRGFSIFPLSLILQCPATGLKKLTFTRLDSALLSHHIQQPFYRRLILNSLAMGTSTSIPTPKVDVSDLKSLKITDRSDDLVVWSCVTPIVEGCRNSLSDLEVCVEWFKRFHAGTQESTEKVESVFRRLDVQGHCKLRSVTITVTLNISDSMGRVWADSHHLRPLADFIRALAQSNVTTITLVINAELLGTSRSGSFPIPVFFAPPTTNLARLLCNNAGGKKIRLIIRELHNHRTPDEYVSPMDEKAILKLKAADPGRDLENMERSGLLELV